MDDLYSTSSGGVISAGRYYNPLWRRSLTANTWTTIPASNYVTSIDPDKTATYNADYPSRAVWRRTATGDTNGTGVNVLPYSGATWDEQHGVFWLPLGGGHGDYAGNESYKIRLFDDTPSWSMPLPPSGSVPFITGGLPAGATPQGNSYLLDDGAETSGVYKDGRPRSMHSYRLHVYVPNIGNIMCNQAAQFISTAATNKTWLQNPTTAEWEYKVTRTGYAVGTNMEGSSTYDSTRNLVWYLGAGFSALWSLDPTTWTWVESANQKNTSGGTGLFYCSGKDCLFEVCSYYTNKFAVWNPSTKTQYTPNVSGTAPSFDGNSGITWCTKLGCIVVLVSGGALYTLTPGANPYTDTWTWGTLPVSGAPSALYSGGGTLSRFQYSQRLDGFILLNSLSELPYFFPLS